MKGNLDFLQKSFFSLKTYTKILSINKADDNETEEIQKLQSWTSPHHNKKTLNFIIKNIFDDTHRVPYIHILSKIFLW